MRFLDKYSKMVEDLLCQHPFVQEPKQLYDPINYMLGIGGKRLRPVMLLMGADLFGATLEKAIKPSLAIEYFHNFTLIHDDIMDESPLRRGSPTVHEVYGQARAILVGDALLMKAYECFNDLPADLYKKCVEIFTQTGVILCEGQQYDQNFETQDLVTYDEYIQMISAKTGVLTANSFRMGALIAGASSQEVQMVYDYGMNLGIGFQIMDDYLDSYGNQQLVGKRQHGDIYSNKKTILYLIAYRDGTEQERMELDFWYSKKTDNIDKIYGVDKIFRRNRVEEKSLQLVKEYNQRAQDLIGQIQVPKERKEVFYELANFLLTRPL